MRTSSIRAHAVLAAVSITVLAAVALTPQTAGASAAKASDPDAIESAAQLSETLAARLGERAAGSYYDSVANKLVVNTTDPATVGLIRAAGAEPRTIRFS